MTAVEEFVEFAAAISPRLRRTAYMLCGDWHTAEDLVQITLAKVFVSWHRISRRGAAPAYATRTLVNAYLAGRRVKRAREVVTDILPEQLVKRRNPNCGCSFSRRWRPFRRAAALLSCCATGRT